MRRVRALLRPEARDRRIAVLVYVAVLILFFIFGLLTPDW